MRIIVLLVLAFFLPAFVSAAELININTADSALLETLPEIGPKIAERIIVYRETNGKFAKIEDIQNVKGVGSGVTYAKIAPLITVGDTSSSDSDTKSAPSAVADIATTTITESSSVSGTPEYLPIPTLSIIESVARTVSSGAEVSFSASVYDSRGNSRDDAVVTWSFGDGMRRVGASVYHQYYNPGEYLAIVHAATPDGGSVQKEIIITAKDASILISDVSARGVALTNRDTRTLDISLWRLSSGGQEFKIPKDTQILAGRTVLFSSKVTGLPPAETATLLYPSGEVAASYPETAVVKVGSSAQPTAPVTSYKQVQKVEPIISARTDVQSYDEAGLAPAAATELAAAGAALTELPLDSQKKGLFHSPWFLGLIGVIVAAGGAFVFI